MDYLRGGVKVENIAINLPHHMECSRKWIARGITGWIGRGNTLSMEQKCLGKGTREAYFQVSPYCQWRVKEEGCFVVK